MCVPHTHTLTHIVNKGECTNDSVDRSQKGCWITKQAAFWHGPRIWIGSLDHWTVKYQIRWNEYHRDPFWSGILWLFRLWGTLGHHFRPLRCNGNARDAKCITCQLDYAKWWIILVLDETLVGLNELKERKEEWREEGLSLISKKGVKDGERCPKMVGWVPLWNSFVRILLISCTLVGECWLTCDKIQIMIKRITSILKSCSSSQKIKTNFGWNSKTLSQTHWKNGTFFTPICEGTILSPCKFIHESFESWRSSLLISSSSKGFELDWFCALEQNEYYDRVHAKNFVCLANFYMLYISIWRRKKRVRSL